MQKGTDTFTACYAKFGTRAPPIKALMDELGRWSTKYREYEAVLADCHACYFGQRQQLTAPIIYAKMAQLNAAHADDLPSWVRAGSSFLQRICHSETQLYHRFFPAASDGLKYVWAWCPEPWGCVVARGEWLSAGTRATCSDLLEALTDILYDHVRPIAIKLNDVNMLAELCDIISTEILSESATSMVPWGTWRGISIHHIVPMPCRAVQATRARRSTGRCSRSSRTSRRGSCTACRRTSGPTSACTSPQTPTSTTRASSSAPPPPGPSRARAAPRRRGAPPPQVCVVRQHMAGGPSGGPSVKRSPMNSSFAGSGDADVYSTWYVPLHRTLMALSLLYRCLEVCMPCRTPCPLPPGSHRRCTLRVVSAEVCVRGHRAGRRVDVQGRPRARRRPH
jgi:hypothetical protein